MADIKATLSAISNELSASLDRIDTQQMQQAVDAIQNAPRVFLAGAGRSGLGIRGFAMRLMHLGKAAYVVGDTTTPAIAAGDLLIVGSGSGRTASLVASATKAKSLSAKVLLVTIDANSPIGEMADHVIQVPAPSPKAEAGSSDVTSIQPMGSLFEQTLFILLDSLVVLLMEATSQTTDEMFERHANLE